jgi:hypothetical protein
MAFNGPPPVLPLIKSYKYIPASVPNEIRNPLILEGNNLLNNPNLSPQERANISALIKENDYKNMEYLSLWILKVKNRLHLQGGRRRRRRTRRTRRNKRSTRRR